MTTPEAGGSGELGSQTLVLGLPFVAFKQVLDSDAQPRSLQSGEEALESPVDVILGDVGVVEQTLELPEQDND